MGIILTEIQTNLLIWACSNQIQQYSPFIINAMDNVGISLFNKMADVDAILDDRLVFEVITVTFTKIKPDIFGIFRKKSRVPETYSGDFT